MRISLASLFFLCCTVSDSVYADTDQTYDIFWRMLVKDKKDTIFVRCDSPLLKMKIVRMADANTENIDKAYQIFNQKTKKSIYFAFIGNVTDAGSGKYIFNMLDVMETREGYCNLSDVLNAIDEQFR